MRERALVTGVLLPVGLYLVWLGGLAYLALIVFLLAVAAWEYVQLFKAGGFRPSGFLVVGGTIALLASRHVNSLRGAPFYSDTSISVLLIFAALVVHLIDYERGARFSGTDFAITLGGFMYLGFAGGFLLPLRYLPDGFWWFLTVLPAVWLTDTGAYVFGSRFGRRQLSPRLSPKKTWEGFLAGIVTGTLGTALLALGWQALAIQPILVTPQKAALIGLIIAIFTPLGDLGQSMIKRQVGIKDSGHLLPGHGGLFDRVDTWIWGAVLGYYTIVWFLT